jgi:hypothetical protein
MPRAEKTVFISYRRKDMSWALNVYQYLTNHGYDVFFDFTSISSGAFEQVIISNIKARAHFLVILTPSALDRCNDPGDWLRREIEIAIREKRNIVPLFFDGFSFSSPAVSEKLTGQLEALKQYNGLDMPIGFFDEAMERLCRRYLKVTLNAVLHPISDQVQQVVNKQQIAANQAIQDRDQAEEKGGENTSVQRSIVMQEVIGEKAKEKQQRKFDSRRWGLEARLSWFYSLPFWDYIIWSRIGLSELLR